MANVKLFIIYRVTGYRERKRVIAIYTVHSNKTVK